MNELQVVERSPKNEVAFGQQAATALMDIVRQKKLARKFGGEKEHIYFEGWQALAEFYGATVIVNDAEPVEIDGVKGAKATAKLVRMEDGMAIGAGVAYCMRDEPNWRNKPWFQLSSMAQTRAGSKAVRMKLAWVAAMAGYSGTPAEEMDGVFEKSTPTPTPQKKRSSHHEALSKPGTEIKESWDSREADLAEIRQLVKATGTNEEKMLAHYKLPSLDELTKEQAGQALNILLDRKASMDE